MDPHASGKIARTLETLHALCYFAPEVDEEVSALGVRPGRTPYFAARSAPMGRVGPGVVAATFFVFNPSLVAKLLPPAWEAADPADVVAARLRGVDAAYHRLLGGEVLAGPEVAEAAELVRTAAAGCDPAGRPLYAAHADLDWPDPPHLALWHGLTLLREFRGDGHIAALLGAGLSGIESLVSHTATGKGFTQPAAQATRAWSDEQWAAAVASLAGRGLMDADGALTDDGLALRRSVEDATDVLAAAPWDALGDDGAARLLEIGKPLVVRALKAGAPSPTGVRPMTWFSTSSESTAVVRASREDVWAALTDPVLLARLTPFLTRITVDGDRWTWELGGITILGKTVSPVFTERMTFDEPSRIEYTHDPASGARERAGVEGWYSLKEAGEGRTELSISLGVEVDLPLPKAAGPAVRTGMKGVIATMGKKFSSNLLTHLGAS